MKLPKSLIAVAVVVGAVMVAGGSAYAALTYDSQLSQTIANGTLSTDIRDGSNAIVASPVYPMTARNVSTAMQTSTGTFGTATQRVSVDNPGGANNGFSLTLNAKTPGTEVWTNGTNTYPYNGASAGVGQLTVDPSVSAWTALTGTTTAITKGTVATFTGTTPITLATTSATLEDIWNGYVTGIGLSQTIPANTPAGTYLINMRQTVAAL